MYDCYKNSGYIDDKNHLSSNNRISDNEDMLNQRKQSSSLINSSSIIIGVTGHRNLPNDKIPQIIRSVEDFFVLVKDKYSVSEVTLLSPLAEGADMLLANMALLSGFRLVAALPIDAAEYRKDFSESSVQEFDRLVSVANEIYTVLPEEPVPNDPKRGFYYRQAGLHVVRRCDILIALWDGVKRETFDGAGTWETINLAEKSGKHIYNIKI